LSISCEVCGERKAVYVCQKCGRRVCDFCVDPATLTCKNCYLSRPVEAYPVSTSLVYNLFPKLIILGIILTFAGFSLIFLSTLFAGVGTASSGGFIWIFPFPPILFGSGFDNPVGWLTFTLLAVFLGFLILTLIKTY
jgi:uncharacterized membrane protein